MTKPTPWVHFIAWFALPLVAQTGTAGRADEPAQDVRADATHDALSQEIRRRAESLRVFVVEDGRRKEVARVEQPLLRYNDPARETTDAALWAWGTAGRPRALLCLFVEPHPDYGWKWSYELTSLSPHPLVVQGRPDWTWQPKSTDLTMRPFPDAPIPAAGKSARLIQMKNLARRLRASEVFNGEPYELRLLPQPIHRSADAEAGLIDGALFAFAYGTNPEVLALIECRDDGAGPPQWHFGFVRSAAARLTVSLDGRTVWQMPDVEVWDDEKPYFSAFGSDDGSKQK